MKACIAGYEGIVNAIVSANPMLEPSAEEGRTALIFAAARGNVEIVKTLIHAGANINAVDSRG